MTNHLHHSKSTWPIFGMFLTLTACGVSFTVIPPLITTIADEMGVKYASLGSVIMFQFSSFVLAAIAGGWVSERHSVNSRTLVLIGLLIVGLTLALGSTITKLSWFVIWAIPLGFGGGFVESFASILVSDNEKPNSSKLQNLAQLFFCIGAIVASPIVALMLYLTIPWQYMFILFGAFILLILCVFLFLTKKGTEATIHSVQKNNSVSMPVLKDSLFILLAATLLTYVIVESLIACWIAVYFEKQLFVSNHSAALRISIFWIGILLGRLAIMFVSSRFTLWPAMFTGIIVMCIGAVFASLTLSPLLLTLLVFLSGLGAGPIWPTTVAICHAARQRPKFTSYVIAAGALGVVIGTGIGSIIFNYLDFCFYFPSVALGSIVLLFLSLLSYRKHSN